MNFSEEQIAALAPDASSLKSGRELASPGKWQLTAMSDKALWGHCQGSGKLPYQTQVDTVNIAFKCTCPSRKFPCKHGIGLLLLYTRQPALFTTAEEPEWVTNWLGKRTEKAEKKAEQKDKPVDTEAQAKRAEARTKKVSAGIGELQFWIKDMVHNGLLNAPEKGFDFWQSTAKRMVDAQATGLAAMVKNLGAVNFYNDNWKYELTSKLTRLYTLTESYKHIDTLTADYAEEVKTLIGFTQAKEDVLAGNTVTDEWVVLARNYSQDEQLTVERNWLYGTNTKRFALLMQFIIGNQLPEVNLMPGTTVNAELAFYKGVNTYRCLVKQQNKVSTILPVTFEPTLEDAIKQFSDAVTANPFFERVPVLVDNLRPVKINTGFYLKDLNGGVIMLRCSCETENYILAITGGAPCGMFLQLNESDAEPLALWANNKFYQLADAV